MSDVDPLIEAHLQGTINDDERQRLRAWLLEDRAHVREYLRAIRFDQDLSDLVRARSTRHEHGYPSRRIQATPARGGRVIRGPSRWGHVAAAAAAVLLLIGGWLAWPMLARPAPVGITLAEASGAVEIVRGGAVLAGSSPGTGLMTGDTVRVLGDGRAEFAYVEGTRVSLRGGEITLEGEDGKHLGLRGGLANVRVVKQRSGHQLVVETASGRAEVVGTTFVIADIAGMTTLTVSEGSVQFTEARSGERREISAGQRAVARPLAGSTGRAARAGTRPAAPYLGIDLSPAWGLDSELVFVDAMRQAQPLKTVSIPGLTDHDPDLAMRPDGWVASLLPARRAATGMYLGMGGHFPAGPYICTYQGTGTLGFGGDAALTSATFEFSGDGDGAAPTAHRLEVTVHPSDTANSGILLSINDLDVADPPRDIHLVAQAAGDSWRDHPFHEAFLQRWRGCGLLRSEQWEDTGALGQPLSWSNRVTCASGPHPSAEPAELLLALSDELDADLWITIPVEADDSYVAGLAALTHARLGAQRRVYLEYGHGIWEDGDSNQRWVADHGLASGHAPDVALERGYIDRSLAVFVAWSSIFGDDPRLVRVLNFGKASGADLQRRLDWRGAATQADALAICLTFGGRLDVAHANDVDFTDRTVERMRVDARQLLALASAQFSFARANGLRLIGYGAGPEKRRAGVDDGFPHRCLSVVDSPAVAAILGELLRGWNDAIGDAITCDLPTQLIHTRSRSPLGEYPADTPLATYQVLIDALPAAAP